MKIVLIFLFSIFIGNSYAAINVKVIIPPKQYQSFITTQTKGLEFPKPADVYAIIMVESAFNKNAFNPELSSTRSTKVKPSIGLMQVQGGSFDPKTNIKQGVKHLRNNYELYCNKNPICAVKSYNIGIGNYRKGRAKQAGKDYYAKYSKYKTEYVKLNLK